MQQSGPCAHSFLFTTFFKNKNTGLHSINTSASGIFQHWRVENTHKATHMKQWKTWSVLIRGNAQKASFDLLVLADSQVLCICWLNIQLCHICFSRARGWQAPCAVTNLRRCIFMKNSPSYISGFWTECRQSKQTVLIQLVQSNHLLTVQTKVVDFTTA